MLDQINEQYYNNENGRLLPALPTYGRRRIIFRSKLFVLIWNIALCKRFYTHNKKIGERNKERGANTMKALKKQIKMEQKKMLMMRAMEQYGVIHPFA